MKSDGPRSSGHDSFEKMVRSWNFEVALLRGTLSPSLLAWLAIVAITGTVTSWTVQVKDAVPMLNPSPAVTVTVYVPADWPPNVPEINPVVELIDNPCGKGLAP